MKLFNYRNSSNQSRLLTSSNKPRIVNEPSNSSHSSILPHPIPSTIYPFDSAQGLRHLLPTNKGFSAVELLITLFIAAAFMISGYQLYAVVIKDGGEARMNARAANAATDYLQQYKSSATHPCTALTPLSDSPQSVNGLSNVTISVVISCPYSSEPSVSKILVTLKYGTPQQTISNVTYSKPEDGAIVTDGLVLNLDAGNNKSIKGRTSIINWNSWVVSAGGTSDYSINGDGNSRIMDTNPWGVSDIVWDVSNQDAASDDDGGWNGSSFPINNTRMYRFSTWVRRKTIGNGPFYLGTSGGGASVLNRSNAVVNGNPYFSATGWWGNANQWYLVIGYVWPAGSGAGASMSDSGIYAVDGTKVASASDFIWQSTTTTSNHRSYLFYSTDVTTNQQWYQPRVDLVDGSEPTITELRTNAGNTWYDLSGGGLNGTMVNGVGYTTANGEALSFNGVDDYVTFPYGSLPNFTSFTASSWIKITGDGSAGINGIMNGKTFRFFVNNGSNYIRTQIYGVTPFDDTIAIAVTRNKWANITFSYDGAYRYYYYNGALVSQIASTGTLTNVGDGEVGSIQATAYAFNGQISVANIYSRVLTPTEITQNFNALRGRYGL